MASTDPHDFEVITNSEAPNNVTAEKKDSPGIEPDKPIRELFDGMNGPSLVQGIAKFVIFAWMPFTLAWSAAVAIVASPYLPTPDDGTSTDEKMLYTVSTFTQERLNQCRERLTWVDEQLPTVLEECKGQFSGSSKYIDSAKDVVYQKIVPATTRYGSITLFVLAAYVVPFVLCGPFWGWRLRSRVPIWIWVGLGYFLRKRRERRSTSWYRNI